ncbi:bacteriocin immunity protein [Lactiplantibacillus carotarum]|uniref:bacteriocin immunity protein n=1 Tax=Lactiplantibacillus carotarum TaxID=2993456 RepID=UPI00298F3A47|nr:bacteriocin immunity protein [Lactiplantibacillus carotarum]
MLKNENAIALTCAIDVAYDDPEIQAIPELIQLLSKAAQALDCMENHHQVASRLNHELAAWGQQHTSGPAALNALYSATLKDSTGLAYPLPYQPA